MTRVGWIFLSVALVCVAGFLSMVRIAPPRGPAGAPGTAVVQGPRDRPRGAAVPPGLLAIPVAGVGRGAIVDSWGDARDGGARAHHGTDRPAPAFTPVLAAAAGRVEKLFASAAGGTTLYLRSADRRWLYYYAHLAGYAPGLREGQAVRAGDPLGFVGDTGDAGAGNFHLHFGLSRVAPADGWWKGEDVDPFPLLAGRRPRR